jgi:hypothetical protein
MTDAQNMPLLELQESFEMMDLSYSKSPAKIEIQEESSLAPESANQV